MWLLFATHYSLFAFSHVAVFGRTATELSGTRTMPRSSAPRAHSAMRSIVIGSALALALATPPASAQGRGHGHAKPEKAQTPDHHTIAIDRGAHVRVIHEYALGGSLPPALAKREALPPGLRKQLHENGALPPGLEKRLVPVPVVLVQRLPPVPPYYHRYFAGNDLLVVDARTNRLVAIIANVWG